MAKTFDDLALEFAGLKKILKKLDKERGISEGHSDLSRLWYCNALQNSLAEVVKSETKSIRERIAVRALYVSAAVLKLTIGDGYEMRAYINEGIRNGGIGSLYDLGVHLGNKSEYSDLLKAEGYKINFIPYSEKICVYRDKVVSHGVNTRHESKEFKIHWEHVYCEQSQISALLRREVKIFRKRFIHSEMKKNGTVVKEKISLSGEFTIEDLKRKISEFKDNDAGTKLSELEKEINDLAEEIFQLKKKIKEEVSKNGKMTWHTARLTLRD